jgi:hypothetical protein
MIAKESTSAEETMPQARLEQARFEACHRRMKSVRIENHCGGQGSPGDDFLHALEPPRLYCAHLRGRGVLVARDLFLFTLADYLTR